jgi:glycerophosphoryl diester phosphodiesterase
MDIIAHRGNHDDELAPENTLEAFEHAWSQSVSGIELDIHLSIDKHVVVFHDKKTDKIADQNLEIAEKTLKKLKEVNIIGRKRNHPPIFKIPTLDEILEKAPENIKIYIELKCGRKIIPPLCSIFKQRQHILKQIVFIGFTDTPMKEVKLNFPDNDVYLLYGKKGIGIPPLKTMLREVKKCNADGIDIKFNKKITKEFIEEIKNNNISIHTYLSNKHENNSGWNEQIKNAVKYGMDSITTRKPQWLMSNLA